MTSAQDERFTFDVDWWDSQAQLQREYHLIFFPVDNSVEMFDKKSHRTFLKRTICPKIHLENLFINGAVNIFSRQLIIKNFADEYTRNKFTTQLETAFVIISAASYRNTGNIIRDLYTSSFVLERLRLINLNKDEIPLLQQQLGDGKLQYTSGKYIVMQVVRSDATRLLAQYIASSRYTENGTVYASHNAVTAQKHLEIFFSKESKGAYPVRSNLESSSLCLIKPHLIAGAKFNGEPGQIIQSIIDSEFDIQEMEMVLFDSADAKEFYEVYKGVVPEYHAMVDEITSGPAIALAILPKGTSSKIQQDKNQNQAYNYSLSPSNISSDKVTPVCSASYAVDQLRALCGPSDPSIAKAIRPQSLRARFGSNKIENGLHCTDLSEDGPLETQYLFQILAR